MTYAIEENSHWDSRLRLKNIQQWLDGTFLTISGDAIADFDLQAAIAFHREKSLKLL